MRRDIPEATGVNPCVFRRVERRRTGLHPWLWVVLILTSTACAQPIHWTSATTATDLNAEVLRPTHATKPQPAVIYLKNLSTPRLGTDPDGAILADLRTDHLVLVVDYAKHPKAIAPYLAADVLKLRQDLTAKNRTLLADQPVDGNRIFIVAEGFRLKRDVEFARDGDRVLAMDVIYPSSPANKVPTLVEFSCDNAARMGAGSLIYCRDTLLEIGQLNGFAVAMADHPVRPPYKGIDDPWPAVQDRALAAVRKLKSLGDELPLAGKIGAIGFSRGAPFAAMLAARGQVDVALVHGNRFDYRHLLPDDKMTARFVKAWGAPEANPDTWADRSVVTSVNASSSPMYLNTSSTESPEYRHGLSQLAEALKNAKVDHLYVEDADARGHQVTMDPQRLSAIFDYLKTHLRAD